MILSPEDISAAKAIVAARVTIQNIAREVADLTGIPLDDIMGRCRKGEVCRARELVCYVAYSRGFSYPRIGMALGRDHTTIMQAVRNMRQRRGEA